MTRLEARHCGRADLRRQHHDRSAPRRGQDGAAPVHARGRRIRGIHNAFGTEYNWPWYEGLLGDANYYDHGAHQNGNVVRRNADPRPTACRTRGRSGTSGTTSAVPTRVKFLTVDESTIGGERTRTRARQLPSDRVVPVLRRRPRLVTTLGPRLPRVHRRLRASRASRVQAANRQGHPVGDGQHSVLEVTIEVVSTKRCIAGPTRPRFFSAAAGLDCARPGDGNDSEIQNCEATARRMPRACAPA